MNLHSEPAMDARQPDRERRRCGGTYGSSTVAALGLCIILTYYLGSLALIQGVTGYKYRQSINEVYRTYFIYFLYLFPYTWLIRYLWRIEYQSITYVLPYGYGKSVPYRCFLDRTQ
jgi:hypothetical protein